MNKTGPLGEVEKYYIQNHVEEMEIEDLAKKMNRSLASVKKYVEKLNKQKLKLKPKEEDKNKEGPATNLFASNKGSTVMTEAASQYGDEARKFVNRESKRAKTCTIKIK
jgi:predicted transcriptional regulator